MQILITADPYIPVPPALYGGTERMIALLVRGLEQRGHEVVLVAHPDSTIPCTETIAYGSPPHVGAVNRLRELGQVHRAICRRVRRVDIVHSFGRLAGLLPILLLRSIPKIQTYERAISWPGIRRAAGLGGRSLAFTACSSSMYRARQMRGQLPGHWHTIFNAVDTGRYRYTDVVAGDAPLVFLGQLEPMKGPHKAIAVARAAGRKLIVAGTKLPGPAGERFFDREIAPALRFGDVEYIGGVDDHQKNELLGRAAALLFPTFYDEAFGIVMAEAMACGTPVIGFDSGAVPEVVQHERTGFVCRNEREALEAIRRLQEIDRRFVRRECERRFGSDVIVDEYAQLYAAMCAQVSRRPLPQDRCAAS